MIDHSIQTAITGINTAAYFGCPVIVPPLREQEAIAEALSDADALIESLWHSKTWPSDHRYILRDRAFEIAAVNVDIFVSQNRTRCVRESCNCAPRLIARLG
jgi:restriction endonuclease S subunit